MRVATTTTLPTSDGPHPWPVVPCSKMTLIALGRQIQPGVGTGMMSAFRWLRNEKRLEFRSHLLTDDFLQDGSELGVLSVCRNMVYFAEEGYDDSGKVMAYQFRYE